uniref:Follistatin-related protein 1 n=1 Tax=Cyanistes caeruleus TaxID=156563 RepID=A0A8C0UZ56_CYACU
MNKSFLSLFCQPDLEARLALLLTEEPRSKSKICANVFCGAGRECAVTEKGEPTCLCIEKCKPHKRPVCGSNGKTYLNHCELHRDACLTGSKIQVDYDGHCKEKKSENPAASPVVCYQSDRDELRRRVIQWLEAEIIPDGWFSKGSNYSEVLDKYFKSFDDGDSRLDSTEFLKFVEQNETAINITTYMDQETNKLLRGLCVDALIELSDENADWKLSFNEFLKCLSPSFNPPEKKCALEDETYEDGAETEVECNRCVCACGNWVCTAMTCEGPYALHKITVWVWTKGILTLSFQRHQLPRVLLSPAFPQLLHGWFLHNPHMFHVSETQAGTVPVFRKCVTGPRAVLLGFVVWIWCHENSALNLPDQIYSASSWCRPNRSLAATVWVGVSKSAFCICVHILTVCVFMEFVKQDLGSCFDQEGI